MKAAIFYTALIVGVVLVDLVGYPGWLVPAALTVAVAPLVVILVTAIMQDYENAFYFIDWFFLK